MVLVEVERDSLVDQMADESPWKAWAGWEGHHVDSCSPSPGGFDGEGGWVLVVPSETGLAAPGLAGWKLVQVGQSPCGPDRASAAGGGCYCCSSKGRDPGDQTCAALETVMNLCDLCPHKEDRITTQQRCQFFYLESQFQYTSNSLSICILLWHGETKQTTLSRWTGKQPIRSCILH